MSIRRLPFLPWLMGACLLIAQAGMLWHDLGHASERLVATAVMAASHPGMDGFGDGSVEVSEDAGSAAGADAGADTDAGTACAVCLAHAALQASLGGAPTASSTAALADDVTAREPSAVALASRWARHGREPPRAGPMFRA